MTTTDRATSEGPGYGELETLKAIATGATRVARAIVGGVRREEWILLGILVAGAMLCLSSGTGFQPVPMFRAYVAYFGRYVVYVFAVSRIVWAIGARWEPDHPSALRLQRWLLGRERASDGASGADLELVRGLLLLFATLAIYTNVKVRIHFINPAIGDGFFQQLDAILFGTRWVEWLEGYAAASPAFRLFFSDVYMHGYLWMILVLLLAYLRQDRFAIRWLFTSVCLTYMCGIMITVLYPSYGPCFLEAERFSWLAGTDVGRAQVGLATYFKQSLAASGDTIVALPFGGIAAFPSLHVAHMVLLAVISWKLWRPYAWFMISMSALTFVATMAFGWHYAIDAVGGALLAAGIAIGVRRAIRRREPDFGD